MSWQARGIMVDQPRDSRKADIRDNDDNLSDAFVIV